VNPKATGARFERSLSQLILERDALIQGGSGSPEFIDALNFAIDKLGLGSRENPRRCSLCEKPNLDMYMVHNRVWIEAMGTPKGLLHLGCLEEKLGRALTAEDFPALPINKELMFGWLRGSRSHRRAMPTRYAADLLGEAESLAFRVCVDSQATHRKEARKHGREGDLRRKIVTLRLLRNELRLMGLKPAPTATLAQIRERMSR